MPLTLNGTTGEVFPSWTTATRPASPSAGQTGFNTTTGQMESYNGSAWTVYSAATTQGTSGQYLQSAGAGAAPTWATLSATGALIRAPQTFISGTSYTTPAGCNNIFVEFVGGGGGGGGTNSISTSCAGAGGCSIYAVAYISVQPSTAYTINIGAGGSAGGFGTSGGNGGATSIVVGGTTYSSNGGSGGTGATGGSTGTTGATGTTTNMSSSFTPVAATAPVASTRGGDGGVVLIPFIQQPANTLGASVSGTPGISATLSNGYGSSGSGSRGASQNGGAGYQGMMRIWEYT